MVSSSNLRDPGEIDATSRKGRRIGHAARVLASVGTGLALVGVLSAGTVLGARHSGPAAGALTRTQPAAASHTLPRVTPAAPGTAAAPTRRGATPPVTFYLVASQQQADAAQAAIDAAAEQANRLGGTPSDVRVLVVAAEDDAAAQRDLIVDENALRARLGLAEIGLVDLR